MPELVLQTARGNKSWSTHPFSTIFKFITREKQYVSSFTSHQRQVLPGLH